MKKLSMLILAIAMIAVLAVAANAELVMFQNGGADMKSAQGAAGALGIEVKLDEPINIYDYDYMYVRFYMENPDNYLGNGQIEITSSGGCDNLEANWDLNSMPLEQGWNEWVIDLYTAGSSGGMVDYEAVNYFRVYAFTDGNNLTCVDYVAFGTDGDDFSSLNTELGQEIVFEEYVPVNEYNLTAEGESGAVVVNVATPASPANISDYDYLFFRIYVEGADNFTGNGEVELTSKATCDIEEMRWMVSNVGLQEGWNDIMLDLYMPDHMDTTFNWENCNWFRVYQFTEGYMKVELDYAGFGMEDSDPENLPVYLFKASDIAAAAEEEAPAEVANGVIEATEGFANEGADNLFDGDEATKWCLNAAAPVYVTWKTDATTATGYEIVTANDNAEYTGRNPGAWTLYGSKDGAAWTALDVVEADTVLQDVNFTPFTFAIDAPAEYAYYKFEVTNIVGGGVMQISGLNLLTGAVTPSAAPAEEVVETPVEEVVETPVEEVVETPVVEEPVVETPVVEAPQTFDFAIFAAVAAIISAAGYAISKKR